MTVQIEPTKVATSPQVSSPPTLRAGGNGLVRPSRGGVRFTTKQYLRMDRAGLFEDSRVELVLGRIYPMNAQADPHQWAITKGTYTLARLFPIDTHWVVIQGTLRLEPNGAPDPDFHLFDIPAGNDKTGRLPFLVIEVSDSTYRHDSTVKVEQYASAGIADYWIINIPKRRVEVYRCPDAHAGKNDTWGYAEVTQHTPGKSIAILARRDVSIAVTDILP